MELDKLKQKWHAEISKNSPIAGKNKEQLEAMLNGKTIDYMTSMRKKYQKILSSLIFSMLLMIFTFSIISDGFSYPGSINGFVIAMFFFNVIIAFLWIKLTSIVNLNLSDSIKERIIQVINLHKKNRRSEIAFISSFLTGLIIIGTFVGSFSGDASIYIGLGLMLLFATTLISIIVGRYGKRIGELKECLREFEQKISENKEY